VYRSVLPDAAVMKDSLLWNPFLMERRYSEKPVLYAIILLRRFKGPNPLHHTWRMSLIMAHLNQDLAEH